MPLSIKPHEVLKNTLDIACARPPPITAPALLTFLMSPDHHCLLIEANPKAPPGGGASRAIFPFPFPFPFWL